MTIPTNRLALACVALLAGALPAQTRTAAYDTTLFRAMQWRNIGPFRGGRSVAAAGVTGQPHVYYAGYTGGGVWKTENAGHSWKVISDGPSGAGMSGSIGAIAVAESDPNVVYVGTGEHPVRGQSSSYGNGVFKSTDAGKTWSRIGLEATKQIAQMRVHPTNPDIVYVAAQGDRWKGTAERGIYRSTDGGKTWTLVLKGLNPTSGASDLSMDPTNPRILYAGFWDHQRQPWLVRSGGPGSGIWKSTDAGDTWTRLTEGLPKLMGKIGVAVSPANPERVFAIVEAEKGGLFRSDDAGKTWRLLSEDRTIQTRSWYYMHITADPQNADVVYVMNAPITKSIDGGRTFATLPALHGDNHQLWINPKDSRYMINANDGGVSVSLDAGKSWSTQDNQPTAQFYHVIVDDVYPYRLYSGQQDNSSVIIKSRSDGPSIGERDWQDGPGCESANVGVDRRSPRYVYGGCYVGILEEMDMGTGLTRSIMPWPELSLTEPTDKTRYRFNWTSPAVVSQHNSNVVYHGGNVLFRTPDRGKTWTPISPDLTRNDKSTQGFGGAPITNEGAGGEVYGAIVHIAESPHDANTIYVGTDDGLVQLTRDGGKTWTNVTPAGVGVGLANMVEVSPHDAGTVYLALRMDRRGDYAPYAFKSTDYGKSWSRIVNGLREGEPVRVIREDTERRGLLYAGTETGVYVSYDGGGNWQPFSRNLPITPVTDLAVRHGDLYASTEGRAFWALDDLTPLRQMNDQVAKADVFLFAPRVAAFGGGPAAPTTTAGRNPPPGANIFFMLAKAPDSVQVVKLEVLDASGRLLREYPRVVPGAPVPAVAPGPGPVRTMPNPKAGLNSFQWDLRAEPPTSLPGNINIWGGPGGGYLVTPGKYQVRLTVSSTVQTQPFDVRADPRLNTPPAEIAARDSLTHAINARVGEIHDALLRIRDVKEQVSKFVDRTKETPVSAAIAGKGKDIVAKVDTLEPKMSTKAANGQDVINYRNGINAQYAFLLGNVEGSDIVSQPSRERFAELERLWSALRAQVDTIELQDVPAFNKLLLDGGVSGVIVKAQKPKIVM
ncbi:MAG: glycosyl hydrolase repeat-containing protein [Gemmatimonadetes bacterium]|nr:glycosyl hydrolase repeat-containing protein [Gemmatimonadota bacterium]